MADDEFSLRKAAERAAQAQALLENEILVGTFADIRQAYIGAWLATQPRDDEGRQMAWLAVKNLDKVREHLERVVTDGKIALKTLELNEALAPRKKRA